MKTKTGQFLTLFFISACLLFASCSEKVIKAPPTDNKTKKGMNCLFIGHSFFVPVSKVFEKLPGQSGVKKHQQQSVYSGGKGGSPGGLWKGRKKSSIKKILKTGRIELLGMTVGTENSSLEDYRRWIDFALKYNPKTSFFIALCWGKAADKRKLSEYTAANLKGNDMLFAVVTTLRKQYPDTEFFYLNYGIASVECKRLFEAGKLPGIKTLKGPDGIYKDNTSHGHKILLDLCALLWLNRIYNIKIDNSKPQLSHEADLNEIANHIIAKKKYN